MWKRLFAITTAILLLTACEGPRIVGDSACVAFAPIYLSEGAIQAVLPFEDDARQIAIHNETWERLCNSS